MLRSLHNRIFLKKKSGDLNDEVNFPFFILLHKRAKPRGGGRYGRMGGRREKVKTKGFIKPLAFRGNIGLSSRAEVRDKVRGCIGLALL